MRKLVGWMLIIIGVGNAIFGHGITPEVGATQFIIGCMLLDKN